MSTKPAFDGEKSEPKENDKCMETEPDESEWGCLSDFSKRTKSFAADKYKVVIAILCVLLFIFLIIIIALAVQIGTCQSVKKDVYCNSDDCLRSAADIVLKMNHTLNPCNDFYEFSCGQWIEKNSVLDRYGSFSVVDQVKSEIYQRLRHLLDEVPDDVYEPKTMAKQFFFVCLKNSDINYASLGEFEKWVMDIGGWETIGKQKSPYWNRLEVLRRLHVNHGVHPFFKLAVSADDTNPGRNIIKISPCGLGLPDRSYYLDSANSKYIKAYKEFLKDIIKEFGHTTSTIANSFSNVFYYEKRIAEIIPEPEKVLNINGSYEVVTVQQLIAIISTVEWVKLLQSYYPSANITMQTEVGLVSKDYFSKLSGLISSTDDNVFTDYVMWCMLLHYLPHLPQNFRDVANQYYQTLEGVDDVNIRKQHRWEVCLDQTVHYLGHATSSMYIKKYFTDGAKTDVQRMINNILAELSENINSFSWLTHSEKEMVREKIRLANIHIGYPEFILDKEKLQSYYRNFQVKSNNLENIFAGENFLREREGELLRQSSYRINNSQSYAVDVRAVYKYAGNSLEIPAGLLSSPFYHHTMPPVVKYGFLAGYATNKLMQLFDSIGINYDKYGALKPWFSNSSRLHYEESANCLLENINVADEKLRSNLTVLELIREIASVKYSYLAHKKRDANEGLLPGVKYNHDQIFFLTYAQSLCQASLPMKVTVLNDPKYELRNKIRVMNTLQQLPEFAEAFSCSDDSPMKSKKQCEIW